MSLEFDLERLQKNKAGQWFFMNVGIGANAIEALETDLGVKHGRRLLNMSLANARYRELREAYAEKFGSEALVKWEQSFNANNSPKAIRTPAEEKEQSAAETGSFPGPGAPVALPTVSAASLSPAGSPAITAAVATKPATASTTAASPSPAVPPVSSAAPAAAAPQLRGIDRVQAAIAKQIAKPGQGAASTSAAAGKPTAVQLAALGEVLGIERGESDDATLLSQCERAAFESYLRFPGMAADEALASKFSRISADRIKGMLRIERATRQQRIDAIFRPNRRP